MSVTEAETPKYAKKQIKSDNTIEIGIVLLGFLASSPVVAITSKPTNAKKAVAEPANTPVVPYGIKSDQFSGLARVIPTAIMNTITTMFIHVITKINRVDFLTPRTWVNVISNTTTKARKSG